MVLKLVYKTNLHDWNKPQGLILGVTINKDINPYYGLTIETTIGFNNRKNYNLEIINADKPIDQITVSLINRWNITNTIYGYNGTPHKFEVEMLVGLGGLHDFGDSFVYLWGPGTKFEDHTSHITNQRSAVIAKTGFNLNYNINKHWSISAQPSIVWDLSKRWKVIPDWYLFGYGRKRDARFNNKFNSQKAVFQMMVSATYHINFKKHNNKELCNYSQEEVNTIFETSQFIIKLCEQLQKQEEKHGAHDKIIIVLDSVGNLTSEKERDDTLTGNQKADFTKAKDLKALFRVCATLLAKLLLVKMFVLLDL